MLFPNKSYVNVFDTNIASNSSFFTGGLNLQNLDFDPLVTGYAFIIWIKVPLWVESAFPGFRHMTQKNFKGLDGLSDIELQTQEYQYGFAGNDYNVAAGISKSNTEFTLKHQEYSGSPIRNMYSYWVSGIADPETGIATYPKIWQMDYAAKNHTGELLYIVTRPDVNNVEFKNIEFAAYWTNVLPTRIPISHMEYSQNSHDLVEIDMPFKGNIHMSKKVDAFAAEMLKTTYSFVTDPLFDPQNANVAEKTLDKFNEEKIQQQG